MDKKKVAVLFGGCSKEYEISLKSAYSVISAIDQTMYDLIMIGITKNGNWFRYMGSVEKLKDDTWYLDESCIPTIISPSRDHGIVEFRGDGVHFSKVDLVFPVLHGRNGEDGTVQGLLDLAGIPCVGCGLLSSALCMDKGVSKALVGLFDIKNSPYVVLERAKVDSEEDLFEAVRKLNYPLFVKPVTEGSSFGISKVEDPKDLTDAAVKAFCYDDRIIVEEGVKGFEVGCSVLGSGEVIVGEVDEIELSCGFFDYEEKYTLKTSSIHMPARIDKEKAGEIKETAKKIYSILLCSGYARIDMFLTEDGMILFNEVNTIPGFTDHSRFPNMLKGAGFEFNEIIKLLLVQTLAKRKS